MYSFAKKAGELYHQLYKLKQKTVRLAADPFLIGFKMGLVDQGKVANPDAGLPKSVIEGAAERDDRKHVDPDPVMPGDPDLEFAKHSGVIFPDLGKQPAEGWVGVPVLKKIAGAESFLRDSDKTLIVGIGHLNVDVVIPGNKALVPHRA
jgi:hypothetical protein